MKSPDQRVKDMERMSILLKDLWVKFRDEIQPEVSDQITVTMFHLRVMEEGYRQVYPDAEENLQKMALAAEGMARAAKAGVKMMEGLK
jgi:hypothetical protein